MVDVGSCTAERSRSWEHPAVRRSPRSAPSWRDCSASPCWARCRQPPNGWLSRRSPVACTWWLADRCRDGVARGERSTRA